MWWQDLQWLVLSLSYVPLALSRRMVRGRVNRATPTQKTKCGGRVNCCALPCMDCDGAGAWLGGQMPTGLNAAENHPRAIR